MHSSWTLLAVLALSWCAAAQDPPLELKLTPPQSPTEVVNVNLGDRIDTWQCELNRGLTFIVEGRLDWVHVDAAGNEHLIARNKNLQAAAEHFDITFEYDFNTFIHSKLIIKSVREEDLGKWMCRATMGDEVLEATRHLDMFHDMTDIELSVGGVGPYKLEMTEGVQFEEGPRGVKCDVKGGNPQATIHVRLGDKEVTLDEVNSIKMGDGVPTNFHTVAMATVELTGDDTDNALTCVGKVGDFPERKVAVKLDIITFSPSIHCTNKTTSMGDKFVQASCVVFYQKPVKNVSLEVGDSNHIIVAGSDHKHGDTKFFTRALNSTAMEVVIDVYEMMDSHFSHIYYVNVFGHDNKVYREPVIFINAGFSRGGAWAPSSVTLSLAVASLLTLVLVQLLHW